MEKIFKRAPKGADEGDKEKAVETAQPEAPAKKHAAEGHAPKFAWKPKADSDGKNAKHEGLDIPDGLWIKCPHCKELLYSKELENNKKVCHKCGHHFRLGVWERINSLVDEGSFVEQDAQMISSDPLDFICGSEPPYKIKAAQTRQKTGLNEAIITGTATLEGLPLGVAVTDFTFQGASMGSVFGEKLTRLIETCTEQRIPLLTVNSSGGARMQEGIFSLMQMAKTTAALARLGELGVPHFSLLTDPCLGGVTASYASVADIMLAEPGALIGFSGPRIIEQIIKQKLPPGFQSAEFLLEHGMIDQVVSRKELRMVLVKLLRFYGVAQKQAAVAQTQTQREVLYA